MGSSKQITVTVIGIICHCFSQAIPRRLEIRARTTIMLWWVVYMSHAMMGSLCWVAL